MKKILSSVLAALLLFSAAAALSGCDTRNITPCDHYKMARDGFRDALGRTAFSLIPRIKDATGADYTVSIISGGEKLGEISGSAAFSDGKFVVSGETKIDGVTAYEIGIEDDGGRMYVFYPTFGDDYVYTDIPFYRIPGAVADSVNVADKPEAISTASETVSAFGKEISADRFTRALDAGEMKDVAEKISSSLSKFADQLVAAAAIQDGTTMLNGFERYFAELAERIGNSDGTISFWQKNGATVKGEYKASGKDGSVVFAADIDSDAERCVIEGTFTETRGDETLLSVPFSYSLTEKDGRFECGLKITFAEISIFGGWNRLLSGYFKDSYIEIKANGDFSDAEFGSDWTLTLGAAGGELETSVSFILNAVKKGEDSLSLNGSFRSGAGQEYRFEADVGHGELKPGTYVPGKGISMDDTDGYREYLNRAIEYFAAYYDGDYGKQSDPDRRILNYLSGEGQRSIVLYDDGTGNETFPIDCIVRDGDEYSFTFRGKPVNLTLTEKTDSVELLGYHANVTATLGGFHLTGDVRCFIGNQTDYSGGWIEFPVTYELGEDFLFLTYKNGERVGMNYKKKGTRVTIDGERFASVGIDSYSEDVSFILRRSEDNTEASSVYIFRSDFTGDRTDRLEIKKDGDGFALRIRDEEIAITNDSETVRIGGGEFDVYKGPGDDYIRIYSVAEWGQRPAAIITIITSEDYPDEAPIASVERPFVYREEGDGYIVTTYDGDVTVTRGDGVMLIYGEEYEFVEY